MTCPSLLINPMRLGAARRFTSRESASHPWKSNLPRVFYFKFDVMKEKIIVFFLLILIGCTAPKTSMDFYNRAKKQGYKKGKIESAKANYLKAINLDSNNKLPYIAYAGYFVKENDTAGLSTARKYYHKAIAIDSTYSAAWFWLGYSYLLEARKLNSDFTVKATQAKECFTKAIQFDSANSTYYADRAECWHYQNDTANRNADWLMSCRYGNKIACWQVELERSRKQ
jgi:tetratricopeptide (TPR) repeat protein